MPISNRVSVKAPPLSRFRSSDVINRDQCRLNEPTYEDIPIALVPSCLVALLPIPNPRSLIPFPFVPYCLSREGPKTIHAISTQSTYSSPRFARYSSHSARAGFGVPSNSRNPTVANIPSVSTSSSPCPWSNMISREESRLKSLRIR